jgi:hypothetical protein
VNSLSQSEICNLQSAICNSFSSAGLRKEISAGRASALRRRRAGKNKGVNYKSPESYGSCIDAFVLSSIGRDAANKADA